MTYPPGHVLGSQRNGLNHVSMGMGVFDRVAGPRRGSDYPIYSDTLLDWYAAKGVKSARLTFTWEAVQARSGGAAPPVEPEFGAGYSDYWTDLTDVLARLLARGIDVVLSPWQFNRASGDTDIVYDHAAITAAGFADFWGKFATATNLATGNDQRVAFDLINEPHTKAESGDRAGDIGIGREDWFACARAAIGQIRDPAPGSTNTNTIFVPGMAYASASSFLSNGSSDGWLGLIDSANPADRSNDIAVTAHCYDGLGSDSPTVLRDACSGLVTWARSNGLKVQIGEIAINAGDNGRPVHCGTWAEATAQWADWNEFCLANADVLVGWNWWANSAAGWWNAGDSCDADFGFHWGLTLDDGATQTIYMDLIEATLPVPALPLSKDPGGAGRAS